MTQSEDFASAIAFAWWPNFKMISFLEYLVFLWSGFFHRITLNDLYSGFWHVFCTEELEMICRMDFDMFFGILLFDTGWGLCMAIAFAWWPILKMVSFLEYFVFFQDFFFHRTTRNFCRMDFDMFFGILIFDPKWGFCMMAEFQNDLISRIFGVFWSGFLYRTTLNDL